jgi:hypothetical protein
MIQGTVVKCLGLVEYFQGVKLSRIQKKLYVMAQLAKALRSMTEGHAGRFPMKSVGFFIDLIVPASLWPCGRLSFYKKKE